LTKIIVKTNKPIIMKKIIILLTLFSYQNFYSQNLEDIIKKDTLYICFDYGKNQEVQKDQHVHSKMGQRVSYYFRFNKDFIVFIKQNYIDFNAIDIDKKADVLKVPKSFLKKNKAKIINYDFFKKQKDLKMVYFELEIKNKTFYLIDKKEFKNGMIILREVRFASSFSLNL